MRPFRVMLVGPDGSVLDAYDITTDKHRVDDAFDDTINISKALGAQSLTTNLAATIDAQPVQP